MKSIFKSIISIILLILICIVMFVASAFAISSCVKNPVANNIACAIFAQILFIMYIGLLCFVVWLCKTECEDFDKRIKALEDKNERL